MSRRTSAILLVALLTLSACNPGEAAAERESTTAPTVAPSISTTPSLTAAEERFADASYLVEQMKALHPRLYHSISKERFENNARRFIERARRASDAEFLVDAMRLVALPTLKGRDGHTGLYPGFAGVPMHPYPLRLYDFSDGLFVIDALAPYRDLIGAKVTGIGRYDLSAIRRKLYPLITRDNQSTVRGRFPATLVMSEVLTGAGITPRAAARFRLTAQGRNLSRLVKPIRMKDYKTLVGGPHHLMYNLPRDRRVLYLRRIHQGQLARYFTSSGTLYLQYNFVQSPTTLVNAIEEHEKTARRIVVDVRHNPGGDNTQYGSLLYALEQLPRDIELFLIAGRSTFSAAGNFVGEVIHRTRAKLVGEVPGGSPNQFGDSQLIELPHSGLKAYVAEYFVEVVAGERRVALPPDIPTPLSSDDYFSGRDPALEAILDL